MFNKGGDMLDWGYDKYYEKLFSPYKQSKINYLEIGILQGLKMYAFSRFFEKACMYGIDIDISNFHNYPHDESFLSNVKDISMVDTNNIQSSNDYKAKIREFFDIIIDDGDHNPYSIINTFNAFYERLNKNGIYIIEDVRQNTRLPIISDFLRKKNIDFEYLMDESQSTRIYKLKDKRNGILVIRKY
eukprot:gene32046-40502_t